MTKILLLIKNDLFSLGIVSCITEYSSNVHFEKVDSWEEMKNSLLRSHMDLLIIDSDLSNYANLGTLERIRRKHPAIKIIVLGEQSEKSWALPYLRKGVDSVCMASITKDEFKNAFATVMKGKKFMDDELTEFLLRDITNPNLVSLLTVRESEIMQFLIKGSRTVDIARELKLAVSTISTMKNNIYRKMKVTNVVDLIGKVSVSQSRA